MLLLFTDRRNNYTGSLLSSKLIFRLNLKQDLKLPLRGSRVCFSSGIPLLWIISGEGGPFHKTNSSKVEQLKVDG